MTERFVGDPYARGDPYWRRVRRWIDGRYVRHQSHVSDRAKTIEVSAAARGFVLCSQFENWSLAAHEAAASGLPLLLPDLKWSRECFGDEASYFDISGKTNAARLKSFYVSAPDLTAPSIPQSTWDDVATRLIEVYAKMVNSTRPE